VSKKTSFWFEEEELTQTILPQHFSRLEEAVRTPLAAENLVGYTSSPKSDRCRRAGSSGPKQRPLPLFSFGIALRTGNVSRRRGELGVAPLTDAG
jgi:hypothetical protein